MKSSCGRGPPYTQKKGAFLSLKTKRCHEESQQTGLAKSPLLTTITSCSLTYHIPLCLAILHQTRPKNTQVYSSGSSFLMRALVSPKTCMK